MTDAEIARWEREMLQPRWEAALQARREHKRKYKGQPGMPMTIRPERNVKPTKPTEGCVHHWRLEEPCGAAYVQGVCRKCGHTRQFRAGDWGEVPPMRKMRL